MEQPARLQENFFMRYATGLAIGLITLFMFGMALMFFQQQRANEEAKGWVVHTHLVINHIQNLSESMKEIVLSERGYLITENEIFLEAYKNIMREGNESVPDVKDLVRHRSIAQQITVIRELTKDNPTQTNNVNELETHVKEMLAFVSETIEAKRKGKNAAPDLIRGREILNEIRTIIRIMEAEETHLLALRNETELVRSRQTRLLTFGSLLAFYALMSMLVYVYQRTRRRNASQLQRYTDELERNEEELKMQQEELKASNEEIEASNEELEEKTRALEEQNNRIRKQSEELEEARRMMEEKANEVALASKYKSEFLANMSHELRTPLNSLLILAKGLAANEDGNLTEEQMEEARVIYNGGLELLSLINDILDLSKVEAGKISILPEQIHVADITRKMAQQFEPLARQSGVDFPVIIEESLPATLRTDSQRVEQILKNLLSNAFKFTEAGSVTLRAQTPTADMLSQHTSLQREEAIAFSVIDTGIGIDGSKLKDIFEAFQQEDGATDRNYGGTGLGLTIARKFAHILGGEIHVESTKGKGSTFTLILPREYSGETAATAAKPHNLPSPQPAPAPLTAKVKSTIQQFVPDDRSSITQNDKVLLVIEDDRDFAQTLMKIARSRGYKTLAAGNGKNGLLLAAEYPVTAIVLDMKLPDMPGHMVLAQLKDSLATRHIPVHIISGMDEADTSSHKGAAGFLQKPADKEGIDEVFSRIEGILKSQVKKLLVVEDDRNTQIAVERLLRQKNTEILMAGTGHAGLVLLQEQQFDCIILDLKLPDMSGFEWLKNAEKQTGEGKLPSIIVYTGRELTEDEHRELARFTSSIVIKGDRSPERLLDEVTLFLHSVESTLSQDQLTMIRMQHDPNRALQNRTVLLVDDDMRNTFALSKLLRRQGLVVEIADNGVMAIEKLRANKAIELVVMDIMMPVMDGYQAMREIRANAIWQNLPIIALTARAMPEEQERCMEAGANDYLVKPVDTDRLLTLLRVWLFRQEKVAS